MSTYTQAKIDAIVESAFIAGLQSALNSGINTDDLNTPEEHTAEFWLNEIAAISNDLKEEKNKNV